MDLRPWLYFLSLERDFISTTAYVELHPTNAAAFSDKFASLLLLIGSEVDVVANRLCREEKATADASNIVGYQKALTGRFDGFHTIEIDIPRYGISVYPWSTWSGSEPKSPPWWKAYNAVKHDRLASRDQAHQQNVVEALCGLLSLNLYLYRDVPLLDPFPELLAYNFPAHIVSSMPTKALPGFTKGSS